jgi:replicative DNA helicase
MVLHVLLNRPEWVEDVVGVIGAEDFRDPLDRRIFELIVAEDVEAAQSDPDPRLLARIEKLRGDAEDLTHPRQQLQDAVEMIQSANTGTLAEGLRRELAETVDEEHQAELIREIDRLKKERPMKGANKGAAAWAVLRHLEKGS